MSKPDGKEYQGMLMVGQHGPTFLPDEALRHAEAICAGRPTATDIPMPRWDCHGGRAGIAAYLVDPEDSHSNFESVYQQAITSGREMTIREDGMGLRARLRGHVVTLPEELSGGFNHVLKVEHAIAITPCPKRPRELEGCSN